jgi:Methane oxygenase PmoA
MAWAWSAAVLAAACAAPTARDADGPGVAVDVAKDHIDFRVGKELATTYHLEAENAKPYFWPLNAPNGAPVTRAWPMAKAEPGEKTDHVHQKSAWFCHGDVIPEGVELKQKVKGVEGVDFWSEADGHGKIVCVKVGDPEVAKNHAKVVTVNEWRMADDVKILDETRTIHLYDLGELGRLLVLDIDLTASVCPITFGDTKEGSLGVRVRGSITEEVGKGKLTNADGKAGEKEVWGRPSPWCDYSGPSDDKTAGVALFDDPANPYPACWHSRGYGLSAANPFGRAKSGFPAMKDKTDLVKLAKGDHLKLRYGILLHSGDVKEGKVAEAYERFVKLKD